MKSYDFRPLWDATLDIYDAIKDVCEKNNLHYFVAFGTLIGAIRHNGFIPWDDDFDLYMPRPDYEKFIKLAYKHLPNIYSWHSIENDSSYRYTFGKVCENRIDVVDNISKKIGFELREGIFIDIFPLDGLPVSKFGRFFWCVKRAILRRFIDEKTLMGKLLCLFCNDNYKKRIFYNNWIRRLPYHKSSRVGSPSAYDATFTPNRWWLLRKWFNSYIEVSFEDRIVRIPAGYHDLLSNIYGNYMQLPSIENQIPKHLSEERA